MYFIKYRLFVRFLFENSVAEAYVRGPELQTPRLPFVRGIRRCEGDWQEALEGLIRVEVLNEFTDVPEMYEIISKMPDGDEILKDLGELEAVEQHGLPICMNPRALKPKIIIPPSPKRPPPPQPLPTRPRKRGTFKADVEAGIIPPPRRMRRDAC